MKLPARHRILDISTIAPSSWSPEHRYHGVFFVLLLVPTATDVGNASPDLGLGHVVTCSGPWRSLQAGASFGLDSADAQAFPRRPKHEGAPRGRLDRCISDALRGWSVLRPRRRSRVLPGAVDRRRREHPQPLLAGPVAGLTGLLSAQFHYMSSPSSSDRSSLSSNSPDTSPLQQQARPSHPVATTPSLPAAASPFSHLSPPHHQITTPQTKLHQPAVARARNPIPIVNPHTGMRLPSRPDSISPALSPFNGRRW